MEHEEQELAEAKGKPSAPPPIFHSKTKKMKATLYVVGVGVEVV